MTTPADRARRECEEQGLPPKITDPTVLARIARIVATARNNGEGAA